MADKHEQTIEETKHLDWERDAFNRLYYGLWVVFLGGFVLSLHVVVSAHAHLAIVLLAVFRVLAIAGTAVNFLMQYHVIKNLSRARLALSYEGIGRQRDASRAYELAKKSLWVISRCEKPLQIIALAYLLVALVGSFLVRLP